MSVGNVGMRSQLMVQSLVDMRAQLDDLQRQIGTGKKSTTYAGLGMDRSLATSIRAQLGSLAASKQTIDLVNVRLNLTQTALTRMADLRKEAKSALTQSSELGAGGQSAAQAGARNQLSELLELLNTKAGDRSLFAGRAVDQSAVETAAHILDGDGVRAGLKQIIDERRQADLGTTGLGRLVMFGAPGTVTVAEDVAGSPFGFKLNAVSGNLTGATLSGPSGSPPSLSIALASNPNAGESLTVTLNLPDGSTTAIKLAATTATPPGVGEFSIGANATETATNLQNALSSAIGKQAATSLTAASALAASDDFFNIAPGNPPRRVAGPPFANATAQVAGTPANTVTWYTGELASDDARASATARVDETMVVNYGARASEEGIRSIVQNIAAFAATAFDPNSANAGAAYAELTSRLTPALAGAQGTQRVEDIATEIAHAQISAKSAAERHQQSKGVLDTFLDGIEGIKPEEVGAQILTLQTRLTASLQVTANLYQMSLVNYI